MQNQLSADKEIDTIARDTKLDHITCKLLYARGIKNASAAISYLYPTVENLKQPSCLTGMREAVDIIKYYIQERKEIIIFGDYDCDGIGALAILYQTLKGMGANVSTFLPVRAEDGYGLNRDSVEKILTQNTPDLLITVDCGTNSKAEVDLLKSRGIEVVITDHHEMHGDPPECVIINPQQDKHLDPLCGAGVAFKLSWALTSLQTAIKYIDICAISTVADVVPLVGENRTIARLGINQLSKTTNPGLKLLIEKIGKKPDKQINSYDVAFKIAPRLNATGRLSTAHKSLRLLITTDQIELAEIVNVIEEENQERQSLCDAVEKDVYEKMADYDLCNRSVIVLSDEKWEAGVIGIVAARILKKFNRPVILLTREKGEYLKGSCRSIPEVNINTVLLNCSEYLVAFGGHSAAAGLKLKESNLAKFIDAVNAYVDNTTMVETFIHKSHFDLEVRMQDLTLKAVNEIALFEPFGQENIRPVFADECGVFDFQRIGDHQHIKKQITDSIQCIAFNFLNYAGLLKSSATKKILYTPSIDEFRGVRKITCTTERIETVRFSPTSEELLVNFARCAILKPLTTQTYSPQITNYKSGDVFGHLIIVFTKKTYVELTIKYPNYLRCYGMLDSVNPINTILLSPFNEDFFTYYVKIDVYDATENYVNALKNSQSAKITKIDTKLDFDVKDLLSRNDIICLYKYLRMCIDVNNSLDRIQIALEKFMDIYHQYSPSLVKIMYYILLEMDLFKIDENNCISLTNTKTSVDASTIYKACRGTD